MKIKSKKCLAWSPWCATEISWRWPQSAESRPARRAKHAGKARGGSKARRCVPLANASAMVMKLGGGVDAQGNIVHWSHEVWSHPHSTRPGQSKGSHTLAARHLEKPVGAAPVGDVPLPAGGSDRNAIPPYETPNLKVSKHFILDAPLRTSALRTLGGYGNVFAAQSFVGELSAAAGADPVEFRLRHLKDPRARAVIEAAAQRAGWQPGAKGDGSKGRGFAYSRYKNLACYVAIAAEVTIDPKSGRVRLTRAVAAGGSW